MPTYPGGFQTAPPASSPQARSLPKEALVRRSFQFSKLSIREYLLLGVQRMFALLEKLILQSQAGVIRFHRPNRIADRCDPELHIRLAKLLHCHPAISGVMVG